MFLLRSGNPLRLFLALAAAPVFAQIDLGQVRLQPVRRADAGVVALPSFDSVGLDIKVDNGIARTRATLVWTASAGLKRRYHWTCHAPDPETTFVTEISSLGTLPKFYHDTTIVYRSISRNSTTGAIDTNVSYSNQRVTTCRMTDISWVENKLDSIELSTGFSLPADAAVTDLGLWVGDQRQSAWLMDRSKAAAQYNSIVGVRRDPALLESNGNGYYTLRVFPQSTGETRRLDIEIVQAWRKDIVLPVRITRPPSVPTSVWNGTTYVSEVRYASSPRVVAISLASLDGSQVSLDLGADGMLTAGSTPGTRILASKETFQAVAAGGVRESWSAVRDGRPAFGSRVAFRGSEFVVAREPRERVVFLDAIHGVERARRLALLALMQYGTRDGNRVNLLWRERDGGIKRLWKEPKSLTPEAALEAVVALKGWTPSDSVSPLVSLRELLASDSGRVVVHISDVARDAFPEKLDAAWGTVEYETYQRRLTSFNQAREAAWKALGDTMHGRGMKLFGWWNDYQASVAAMATGGYSFGTIESGTWGRWRTGDSLVVPELFGPTRRGWNEGFQGATLTHAGMAVDSFTSDATPASRAIVDDIIFIERPMISIAARRAPASTLFAARAAAPTLPDSLVVTLAGRNRGAGTLELQMRGFWGGLDATARKALQVSGSGGPAGVSVWAREYANMLQPWVWARDTITNAVRNMGRSYRIATSATSFLALEPGVAPFDSVGGQGESDVSAMSSEKASSMVVRDYAMFDTLVANEGSILLDTLSLESLLLGRVLAVAPPPPNLPAFQGLKLVTNGGLEILAGASSEAPRIHILDVSGRELASPAMRRTEVGWSGSWKPATSSVVLVRMIQDGKVQVRRAFVQP